MLKGGPRFRSAGGRMTETRFTLRIFASFEVSPIKSAQFGQLRTLPVAECPLRAYHFGAAGHRPSGGLSDALRHRPLHTPCGRGREIVDAREARRSLVALRLLGARKRGAGL